MNMLPRKNQGFTIIEFMIAGMLGLILLAGIFRLFLGTNENNRLNRNIAQMQNDARFALMLMKNEIEQTGSITDRAFPTFNAAIQVNTSFLSPGIIRSGGAAVDGTAVGSGGAGNGVVGAAAVGNFTLAASDRLAIEFHGTTNCLGDQPNGGNDAVIVDRFDVRAFDNGNGMTPTLYCNDQPLVSNVESLQFEYFYEDPDTSNPRWIDASAFAAMTPRQIDSIKAVRIGLLIASDDDIKPAATAENFQVLSAAVEARNDRRLRQIFTLTVPLMNARDYVPQS